MSFMENLILISFASMWEHNMLKKIKCYEKFKEKITNYPKVTLQWLHVSNDFEDKKFSRKFYNESSLATN